MPNFNRPYIRKETLEKLKEHTPKNEHGQFIGPDGIAIEFKYEIGHKPGYEFRKIDARAEGLGWTQKQVNDYGNNADILQIEDEIKNRCHAYEASDEIDYTVDMEQEM